MKFFLMMNHRWFLSIYFKLSFLPIGKCFFHPFIARVNLFIGWGRIKQVPSWLHYFESWLIEFRVSNVSERVGQNPLLSVYVSFQVDEVVVSSCFWGKDSFALNFFNWVYFSQLKQKLSRKLLSEFILQPVDSKIFAFLNGNIVFGWDFEVSSFNIDLQVLNNFFRLVVKPWCDFTENLFPIFQAQHLLSFLNLIHGFKSLLGHDLGTGRKTFSGWFGVHNLLPLDAPSSGIFLKACVGWGSVVSLRGYQHQEDCKNDE